MIISKLSGGLGNQLFQYAIGKSMAIQKNTTLKLDISHYSGPYNQKLQRTYLLDKYNISGGIANTEDLQAILCQKNIKRAIMRNVLQCKIPYYKENLVFEKTPYFDKNMTRTNKNVILEGYWPNEKYFLSVQETIRNEFSLKQAYVTPLFREYQNMLQQQESVSIHFRRADYLNTDDGTLDLFGICDLEYYLNAINWMLSKISNPFFYIFTDDIVWAEKNLNLDCQHEIISGNEFQDYEELQLMRFCKHNIIANSTFSWWGAWLNENPEKMVVAPRKWYNNPDYQKFYETSDFVPASWVRL